MQQQCDNTFDILDPTFMFAAQFLRKESDQPHSHEFIEIVLFQDGEGAYYVDGQTLSVRKGDLLILNPGTVHYGLAPQTEVSTLEFLVGFSNVQLHGRDLNRLRFPGASSLLHPKEKTFLSLSRLADQMATEARTAAPGRYYMLKAYLTQMIILLYRAQMETPKTETPGYIFESTNRKYIVEQIVDYMDQHYDEKISLDRIAANMYLSPFYVSRVFKSELGDTPINHLIQLRMEKARQLLETRRGASIQEIARCVGYEDAYHFSKLFKKRYGESPSRYRSRLAAQ